MTDPLNPETPEARDEEPRRRRKVKVTDKRRVTTSEGTPPDEGASTEGRASEAPGGPTSAPPSMKEPEPESGDARPEGGSDAEPQPESADGRAAEYLDHLQRLKAEFDNYRKRVLKEQTRAVELATEPLMAKLLEVLDEFELALIAAERKPEFERFLHGVQMVYGKLNEILRSEGLEAIDAHGKAFDPEIHEALLRADDGGEGDAYVADVLRTGYRLRGHVLRPSGVKVGHRQEA